MTPPAVELKDVSHRFDARWAISDINILRLKRANTSASLAPTAAGKQLVSS